MKNKKPELVYEKHRKYWASWDGKNGGYTYEKTHKNIKTSLDRYNLQIIK